MPLQFSFFPPGYIVFGRDARLKTGALLQEWRCGRHIMLLHDADPRCEQPLTEIAAAVKSCGMSPHDFSHTLQTTAYAQVERGLALVRRKKIAAVVAVGGTAAMDLAKAIVNRFDGSAGFFDTAPPKFAVTKRSLRLFIIPQRWCVGSALSNGVLLFDNSGKQECRFWNARFGVDVAILDPCLMEEANRDDAVLQAMGVMAQCIDRYTGVGGGPIADAFALEAIRMVADTVRMVRSSNAEITETIMAASAMAAMAANSSPSTILPSLTPAHGEAAREHRHAAYALALPFVVKARASTKPRRLARVGEALGVALPDDATPEEVGALVAGELAQLNNSLGIVRLRDYEIDEAVIDEIVISAGRESGCPLMQPTADTDGFRRYLLSVL